VEEYESDLSFVGEEVFFFRKARACTTVCLGFIVHHSGDGRCEPCACVESFLPFLGSTPSQEGPMSHNINDIDIGRSLGMLAAV
jgi:hypothetical protein